MTVIELECFMEVCKQRNFSKAAANLYLSQPTLSRHIQALEEELRATLFIRANNTIRLTAIGQALYPTLEKLYQEFRNASAEMQEIVDRHTGLFRIGVAASLQLHDEHRLAIQQVKAKYPSAKIQVCHMNMSQINASLMSGAVDVLFALEAFVPPSDKVHSCQLCQEKMYLAVPANHPNANLPTINQDNIKDYFPELDFCLLDATTFDPQIQGDLKSGVKGYDDDNEVVKVPSSSYDMEDILLMINAGLGVTCINESCILKNNPLVHMIPLVEVTPEGTRHKQVSLGVYWIDKNYSPILKTFVQSLKSQIK